MKKYKLVKAYPNSPNEGTIVRQDDLGQYVSEKPLEILEKVEVEGYPSFWEEVKEEPNYLITAFRDLRHSTFNHIWRINSNNEYSYNGYGATTKEHMMNTGNSVSNGSFEIYSVKSSKGEEFTIGDEIIGRFRGASKKIEEFKILNDKIVIQGENGFSELDWLTKVKIPIYTTTDGVELFEGQRVILHVLRKEGFSWKLKETVLIVAFSQKDKEVADRYLTFTSEENKDKYIKDNQMKPVFVSSDGVEIFEGDRIYTVTENFKIHDNPCNKFDGGNDVYVYFSTKELAQEYIDNNKPKFSLKEIESCYPSPTNSPLFTTFIANLKKLGK